MSLWTQIPWTPSPSARHLAQAAGDSTVETAPWLLPVAILLGIAALGAVITLVVAQWPREGRPKDDPFRRPAPRDEDDPAD